MDIYYKGDYPIPYTERYLCKKSDNLWGHKFVSDTYYDVSEIQTNAAIVINNIYFYFRDQFNVGSINSKVVFLYDYFYTGQEMRKLKLLKLKELTNCQKI